MHVFRPPATEPGLSGKAGFGAHAMNRLAFPRLHAESGRMVSGDTVVDHERSTGLDVDAVVEAIAVYRIASGLIRAVWF